MHNDLKHDVLELTDEALEIVQMAEELAAEYGYPISADNPVICLPVPGGWRIVYLETLTPEEQSEAISHELGHLLLRAEGLAPVSIGDGLESVLAQEMNNVISHRFILGKLAKVYGIGSGLHIRLREAILAEGEELIKELEDEIIMLHAVGLQLLDLTLTTEGNEERIAELVRLSADVKFAYEAGQEYLVYPSEDLSVEEQWQRVKGFLERLHYDTDLLHLCG